MFILDDYKKSANYIKEQIGDFVPETLMILGSGLGFFANVVENPIYVSYDKIPNFQVSTAPGHEGRFVFGTLSGHNVVVMQGRLHAYEGYNGEEIGFPIRVCKLLGVKNMVVTNAAGGANLSYKVGQIVVLNDFIKFACPNPLIGANIDFFGERFFDVSETFDKNFRVLIKEIGKKQGVDLQEGVYFYSSGPNFETPAEIRAIRTLGGDVVGMSTVHECLVACHCGIRTLGLSLVTNMAAGVLDQPLTTAEVLVEGKKASEYFSKLVLEFLNRI